MIILPCAALLAAAGCRTNKDILDDYERDLLGGAYAHAAVEVTEKSQDDGGDQLLWMLQAAGANRLAGDTEKAIEQFDRAEDIFAANDRQSVFKSGVDGSCAMLTNDRAFPFAGGGQDRIFTCLYKAIDYATMGNVAATRTELNRAAQHQDNWLYERRKDIEAAKEQMQQDAAEYAKENKSDNRNTGAAVNRAYADSALAVQIRDKTGFDPRRDGNLETLSQRDYLNVYAQHVCGVFRWLTDGDGYDYFKGLTAINPTCELLQRDLREAAGRHKPQNQVWIYVEDGLAPCREEWRFDLPFALIPYANRYILYAGMAIPYLRYRNAACATYSVSAGRQNQQLGVLQNMDKLLKVEHDVYLRGALTREITRAIVKVGAQVALGVACDACDNNYARIAMRTSQLTLAAYAASVTQADLRSWTTLPKTIYATRVERPASGQITLTGNGIPIAQLQVPPGNSLVFISKPAAAAAPVIRYVSL